MATAHKNIEEARREAQEANAFLRKARNTKQKCSVCRGKGRAYAPLFGDPHLGYVDAGICPYCKGTGNEKE